MAKPALISTSNHMPASGAKLEPMDLAGGPARGIIPTCAGCHSMREYETCEGGCHERRCELVGADQLDELLNAASELRLAILELISPVELLSDADPALEALHSAYHAVQLAAREALHEAGLQPADLVLPPPPTPVVIWRCEGCGAVDAMQPCLGICVWRPVEWVEASAYAAERLLLVSQLEFARKLLSLVTRLALATPRAGAWKRNWDSLRREAVALRAA